MLINQHELLDNLPPVRSEEEYYQAVEHFPCVNPVDRKKSAQERMQLVYHLNDFRIARDFGYEVDWNIAMALRKGYSLSVRQADAKGNLQFPYFEKIEGDTAAFTLIGLSGTGKTTTLNESLKYYPQVIEHVGENYRFHQLLYIKVQCPASGSMKSFYDSCFEQIEKAFGPETINKNHGRTAEEKAKIFKKLANRWHLGLLIIDEIQNLFVSKKYDLIMNQLLTLSNELCVPIAFIGTEEALKFFDRCKVFLTRRLGNKIMVKEFEKDVIWDNLMQNMWAFQWMQEYVPLTSEMSDVFYDVTQGVISHVVKLFQTAQIDAIKQGKDTIKDFTAEFVRNVAKERLFLNDYQMEQQQLRTLETEIGGKSRSGSLLDDSALLKKEKETAVHLLHLEDKVEQKKKEQLLRNNVMCSVVAISKFLPKPIETKELESTLDKLFKDPQILKQDEETITKKVMEILLEKNDKSVQAKKKINVKPEQFEYFAGVI